jgi:hypothetical protein
MPSRPPVRYVVLGLVADIEAWRRARGLSRHEVFSVSTRDPAPMRGVTTANFAPDFEVVELPSWSLASDRTRQEFERNLTIAGHTMSRPPSLTSPLQTEARC